MANFVLKTRVKEPTTNTFVVLESVNEYMNEIITFCVYRRAGTTTSSGWIWSGVSQIDATPAAMNSLDTREPPDRVFVHWTGSSYFMKSVLFTY